MPPTQRFLLRFSGPLEHCLAVPRPEYGHNISDTFGVGLTHSVAFGGELKIPNILLKTLALAGLSWFVINR